MKQNEKSEKLYDGITNIRDDLIDQAKEKKKSVRHKWKFAAVAAVLAIILTSGITLWTQDNSMVVSAHAIAEAEYPKMPKYPDESKYISESGEFDYDGFEEAYDVWWKEIRAKQELVGYQDTLDDFFMKSTRQFLAKTGKENRVYSPLNVYMALGMLAELTDGDSRQQILDLLGSKNMKKLRKQASDLWNANYWDDGAVTSILASSLWLNKDVSFVQSTMDTLANTYYASSYQGKMGSAKFDKLLQSWLNDQTGGLLKEQASSEKLSEDTILALATTIYFRAKWHSEFSAQNTKEGVFHAASADMECDFLNQKKSSGTYYWGEKFSAVAKSLEQSGNMWFLLPDEGVTVDDLLKDNQAMEFLLLHGYEEWDNQKYLLVNLSVPKFDVSSKIDLRKGLKKLGVKNVFQAKKSDFSPMTKDMDGIYLSQASHAARVAIDEEGVIAAAYTVMATSGAGMPPEEEVDFILDRPFLFAITGRDGVPLFVGVVNCP